MYPLSSTPKANFLHLVSGKVNSSEKQNKNKSSPAAKATFSHNMHAFIVPFGDHYL